MKLIKKSFSLGFFILLLVVTFNFPWKFLNDKLNENNENIVSLYQKEIYDDNELAIPTIDSFSYQELDSNGVTINWTITDTDSTLKNVYLYNLSDKSVFKTDLSLTSDSIRLDNLIMGEEYNLELRGTWLDPDFSSGEIKSSNDINFTIPYDYDIIPTINNFNIEKIDRSQITFSFNIDDPSYIIKDVFVYDNIKSEKIYKLSEREILSGEVIVNYDSRSGEQSWSLNASWENSDGKTGISNSIEQTFTIENKNSIYWLYLLIFILMMIIFIILIMILVTNKRKTKTTEIQLFVN